MTTKFYFRSVFIALFLGVFLWPLTSVASSQKKVILQVIDKMIMVDGKKSQAFDVVQPDGTFGYVGNQGEMFDVTVQNKTHVPLVLHWHGMLDPNDQDGVPYVTQLPIPPGGSHHYLFKLKQEGTYWLHSHYQLQEQKLMAAPLIIHDPNAPKEKEALMFIQDFTFKDPKAIYKALRSQKSKMKMDMDMKMDMKMDMSSKMKTMDVSDVQFDAYLVNHRTLKDPEVVNVTPGETVHLRLVNASASSNYTVDLGKLTGTLFAVDAEHIKPVQGQHFQIAIGNRLDIRVKIPSGEGAYPILVLPEGVKQQTGLILKTAKALMPKIAENTTSANPILNYNQDLTLQPEKPLSTKPVQQSITFNLQGDMQTYHWTINGESWPRVTPFIIKPHERLEMVFNNKSGMAHPMHLHGHVFELSEINGQKINGRKGDTVDVMPHSTVKVILDTDNPGIWMMHCHVLYHQMGGMMTTINYEGYPDKFTLQQRLLGEKLYDETPFPKKK